MQNSCLHSNLACGVLVKIQEGGKDERKSRGTPINPCKEMPHTFPCVQLHEKQIRQKCPWGSGVLAVDMWRWSMNCEVCSSPELHSVYMQEVRANTLILTEIHEATTTGPLCWQVPVVLQFYTSTHITWNVSCVNDSLCALMRHYFHEVLLTNTYNLGSILLSVYRF